MKRYLALLFLFICILSGHAQETYKIVSNSSYNIRTAPNLDSKVIGTTNNNSYFDVYEIKDGWAKIRFGDSVAYVKSQCLKKNPQEQNPNLEEGLSKGISWLLCVIFTLTTILLLCSIVRWKLGFLPGFMFYLNWGCYLLLCVLVLFSIGVESEIKSFDTMEFEYLSPFGFIFYIILTAIMLIVGFWGTLEEIKFKFKTNYSMKFGIYSLVIGFLLSVLVGFIWTGELFIIFLLITIITQLVQAIIIFREVYKKSNIFIALLSSITYLIGLFVTIIIASILLLGYFLFRMLKGYLGVLASQSNDHHTDPKYPYYY